MPQPLLAAFLVLVALAGCGGGGGGGSSPPDFHPVAGGYVARVTSVSGAYLGQIAVGATRFAAVSDDGILNTTDSQGSPIWFRLSYGTPGTTAAIIGGPRPLGGGQVEIINSPNPITSMTGEVHDANGNILGVITYTITAFANSG